jgi:hypothetical protein
VNVGSIKPEVGILKVAAEPDGRSCPKSELSENFIPLLDDFSETSGVINSSLIRRHSFFFKFG